MISTFPCVPCLPFLLHHILEFISYKYRSGCAFSTIRSAISALSFIQKSLGFQDVASNFLVQKALLGVKKLKPSKDIRDPITFPMLTKMVDVMHLIFNDCYTVSLLRCMYVLAFRAFLRISEMTFEQKSTVTNHCINLSNISINNRENLLEISFHSFKHKSDDKPFHLVIKGDPSPYCPVRLLAEYLNHRKYAPGPLFILQNAKPVDRKYFNDKLAFIIQFCGFNKSNIHIRSHSFRIGAATYAIQKGYTYEQVEIMGRWHSQAFKRYIRVTSFINER